MLFFSKWSLRTQLVFLVIISIFPALSIILYSGFEQRNLKVEEMQKSSFSMMQTISNRQQVITESTRLFLVTLSGMPEVQRMDAQACNALFRRLLAENTVYANMFLLTNRGILISSAVPSKYKNFSDRKYFRDALSSRGFSTGEYLVARITSSPVFTLSYPVLDEQGKLIGVLGVALDLRRYESIIADTKLPEKSVIVLSDHKGVRVYRYPEGDKYIGLQVPAELLNPMKGDADEGTFIEKGVDGVERIYAYKKFRLSKGSPPYLYLRLGIPKEGSVADIWSVTKRNLIMLGVVFALALISAWYLGSYLIAAPLNKLIELTNRLRHGERDVANDLHHSDNELGRLAEAFDKMAVDLKNHEDEQESIEETLRQSEEQFRSLTESAPDAIFVQSGGRFVYVNSAMLRLLGASQADELLGREFMERVAPEYHERVLERIKLQRETGKSAALLEQEYVCLDDSKVPVETTAVAIKYEGEDAHLVFVRDITDRKRAEEKLRNSESQLRAILDATPFPIALVDTQDNIVDFWSRSALTLFGHTAPTADEWYQIAYPDPDYRREVIERWKPFLKTARESRQTANTGEYKVTCSDGSVRICELYATFLADRLIVTFNDITERKLAEMSIRESEEKFSKAFEKAPLLMTISSIEDGTYLDVNEKFMEVSGFEREEAIGKTSVELGWLNPKDRELLIGVLKKNGFVEGIELELEAKDKRNIFCLFYGEVINIGGQQRLLSIAQDISESKRAKEALRMSEERFRLLSEAAFEAIAIHEEGVLINANDQYFKMFGYEPDETLGKQMMSMTIAPEAIEFATKQITTDSLGPYESIGVRKDGSRFPVEIRARKTDYKGRKVRFAAIVDITERKRAEMELSESRRWLADIIEFLPDATLAINMEGRIIIWNKAIEEMTGIPATEMIGKGNYAYTIPFYGEARPQLMDLVFEDKENIARLYPQIHREGDIIEAEAFCNALYDNKGAWVYAKAAPLLDQNGSTKGVIEIIRDITKQKRSETALLDYQRNLADIINFLPDATFVIDKNGIVTAWNRAIESLTEIKAEEMIGKGNYEYAIPFYGDRRPILIDLVLTSNDDLLMKSYDAVQQKGSVLSGEVYVPKALGGKGAYLWGNASLLYSSKMEVIGAIQSIRDITERKQADERRRELEVRLNRAEKMEALGTLAGGVAHDLNNVLGIVVGYAEMLMDEMDESSPLRDDVMKIMEGGNRSAAIVQDLLTLARRGVQTQKVVNLNATITDYQKTPEFDTLHSFHRRVHIKTDLETDLLNIMGSPVHLGKTIINLVTNAMEAMTDGGTLTISTSNQSLDKPIQGYDTVNDGDYVVLSITDTGEGISGSDIKHIFEPFYTKKIMGRSGTGLGLAVVWGTVKDHDGYINVQSEVGKGTTFTLYFPVTREEIAAVSTAIPLSDYIGNDDSILVIDDIKEQRELAAKMLGKLNYKVNTVSSGEEAVKYLQTEKADLIILDMIMDPGMDGLDTYKAIVEIHPKQKAIIVSGFSETERVKEAKTLGAGDYLRKPYVQEILGLAVRKELDRK